MQPIGPSQIPHRLTQSTERDHPRGNRWIGEVEILEGFDQQVSQVLQAETIPVNDTDEYHDACQHEQLWAPTPTSDSERISVSGDTDTESMQCLLQERIDLAQQHDLGLTKAQQTLQEPIPKEARQIAKAINVEKGVDRDTGNLTPNQK